MRFADIAAALSLPNSSTHGLLQTMVLRGFLELDSATRTYTLGLRLWELAQTYRGGSDLVEFARPIMDELVSQTQETVQLARLDGVENVYLAIAESPHPMKLMSSVGTRLFAHATGLGKVLLASLDDVELRARLEGLELPRFTPRTIVDPQELMLEISRVRRRGYAIDREEYQVGCRCIAMPIRDGSGAVIAAMSVSIPTPRYSREVGRRVRVALEDGVSRLSRKLGYAPLDVASTDSQHLKSVSRRLTPDPPIG